MSSREDSPGWAWSSSGRVEPGTQQSAAGVRDETAAPGTSTTIARLSVARHGTSAGPRLVLPRGLRRAAASRRSSRIAGPATAGVGGVGLGRGALQRLNHTADKALAQLWHLHSEPVSSWSGRAPRKYCLRGLLLPVPHGGGMVEAHGTHLVWRVARSVQTGHEEVNHCRSVPDAGEGKSASRACPLPRLLPWPAECGLADRLTQSGSSTTTSPRRMGSSRQISPVHKPDSGLLRLEGVTNE